MVERGLLTVVASLLWSMGSRRAASVVVARGLSSCGAWALEREGFSSCGSRASVAVACKLSSCGTQA